MNKSVLEKCQDEYERLLKEKPLQSKIEMIAQDIREKQDKVVTMEFVKSIGKLLEENGIKVNCTANSCLKDSLDKNTALAYGVTFDSLDCAEHDKKFTDKIAKLEEENERLRKSYDRHRRKICDLESELSVKGNLLKIKNGLCGENDLSGLTPIEVADLIIKNFKQGTYPMYERDCKGNIKYMDIDGEKYAVETGIYRNYEEVRQIAEHLLVYCNHNSEE